MSDAPPMMPDCKLDVTGAALIGCTAWLERPALIVNKIKASGLLKIVSLSSLQETGFLPYSNHRRASNPTKKLNMKKKNTYIPLTPDGDLISAGSDSTSMQGCSNPDNAETIEAWTPEQAQRAAFASFGEYGGYSTYNQIDVVTYRQAKGDWNRFCAERRAAKRAKKGVA